MNKIKSRNVREVVISLDYKKTLNEKLIKFNNYNNIYILYDFNLQNNSFIVFLKKTLKGKYIPIKLKNELTDCILIRIPIYRKQSYTTLLLYDSLRLLPLQAGTTLFAEFPSYMRNLGWQTGSQPFASTTQHFDCY